MVTLPMPGKCVLLIFTVPPLPPALFAAVASAPLALMPLMPLEETPTLKASTFTVPPAPLFAPLTLIPPRAAMPVAARLTLLLVEDELRPLRKGLSAGMSEHGS